MKTIYTLYINCNKLLLNLAIVFAILLPVLAIAQPTAPTISLGSGQSASICNGNTVTLTSSGSTAPNSGSAINFPSSVAPTTGSPQYITLPSTFHSQFTSAFTFECWVKPGAMSNYNRLLKIGNIQFEIARGGLDYFFEGPGLLNNYDPAESPVNGTWQHVAFTLDGTNCKFYVNGTISSTAVRATTTLPTSGTFAGINAIGVGTLTDAGAYTFNGQIDEIRMWNTARTASEISSNYNKSVATNATGLVAYFRADEATGTFPTTLVNSASTSATATLTNFPTSGTSQIVSSGVSSFTSNNISYSWTANTANPTSPTTGATVSASPTATTTYTCTATDTRGNTNTNTQAITVSGSTAPTVSPASFNGCASQVTLTCAGTGPFLWSTGVTTNSIVVTTSGNYYCTVGSCNSNIIPVTFSGTNSTTLPTITAGGTTTFCSGSSVNLTASATGTNSGGSINFSTDNAGNSSTAGSLPNYIALPSNFNSNFNAGFTFECWVKPQTMNFYNRLLRIGNINFEIARTTLEFYFEGLTGGAGGPGVAAGNAPVANTWQHVAFTLDGTNLKFYINGVLKYTVAHTTYPSANATGTNYIGVNPGDAAKTFKGELDEIRFWNVAKTASELTASMNQSVLANASGLIAYYRVDETIGSFPTTLVNSVGASASTTATLTNFPTSGTSPILSSGVSSFTSNNITYSWLPTSGLNTASGAVVTATPSVTTTYTVTATNASGCSYSNTSTVTILASPSFTSHPTAQTGCNGDQATFTVVAAGGGTLTYQWQQSTNSGTSFSNISNGTGVAGATTASLTLSGLISGQNGYQYRCVVSGCSPSVTSNAATLTVATAGAAAVSISASPGLSVCTGNTITFTATPTLGGTSPSYVWKINGNTVSGQTASTFATSSLANGDVVTCVLTSNSACATPNTATSNGQTVTIVANGGIAASVAITSSIAQPICPNTGVIFTATPTNGGTSPSYLWKVNGITTGITTSTYTTVGLNGNDVVTCEMTSGFSCATPIPAVSNSITITPNTTPTVTIVAPSVSGGCASSQTYTANVTNGGATPSYQWKRNGANVSTATTYTDATLVSGDVIGLTVTRSETCGLVGTASTSTYTGSTSTVTQPTITPSGATANCNGTAVTLTAASTFGTSGASINFATDNQANSTTAGSLPNYIALSSTFNSNFTSGFTFECWVKPQTMNFYNRLLKIGTIEFEIARSGLEYFFEGLTGGAAGPGVSAGNPPISGTWQHVAFTLDGANLKFYINGVLKLTTPHTTYPASSANGTNYIGVGDLTDAARTFKGELDEIRFWNSTRTQAEITANMNQSVSNTASGLIAYYRADGTVGSFPTSLTNSLTTANTTATLMNFPTSGTSPVLTSTVSPFTSNNVSYSWSPSAGLNTTTGSAVIATPSVTTTYTVTATNGTCSSTRTQTITIKAVPAVTSQPSNFTSCTGENATFTIGATGDDLTYQWQESTNGGTSFSSITNGGIYSGATTASLLLTAVSNTQNTYKYRCVVSGCTPSVTSNTATLTISGAGAAAVSITTSPGLTICSGTAVTFTATPTLGGNSPAYVWKINGNTVSGQNAATFTTSTLSNNDVVTCVLNSSASCASPSTATSNSQSVTVVGPGGLTASVAITSSVSPICPNTGVIFTATPTNGGTSPTYLWKLNGSSTGVTTATYTAASLNGSDAVTCEMTSSFSCATPLPATSNTITVTPNTTPTVTIVSPSVNGSSCASSQTFTANVTNGGAIPVYQWTKNGSNVSTSTSYSDATLRSGDVIGLTVTRSESCGLTGTATSATYTVSSSTVNVPTISASGATSFCNGNSVTLTAAATMINSGNSINFATANFVTGTADGERPLHIALANNFNSNFTSGFTFECWVKPQAMSNFNRLLRIGDIQFEIARGNLDYYFEGLSGGALNPTATPVSGTWQHVAFTLDGSNLKFYVNGVLNATGTHTNFPSSNANGNNYIGIHGFDGGIKNFLGELDEIRFWNTAKTQAEISANMNQSVSTTAAGLVAYYRADETLGSFPTTLANSVGISSSTSATLTNFPTSGTSPVLASTLTGFTSDNVSYSWSPSNSLNVSTGKTVIASPTVTTTYTVTAYNSTCSSTKTSTVTVKGVPTITTQPSNFTSCSGDNATFTIVASGDDITYQWQESNNGGSSFSNITNGGIYGGATTASLVFTGVTNTQNNYQYRCVVSGCTPAATSNAATLSIGSGAASVSITASPGLTICSGTAVTFTATPTLGGNSPSYVWKINGSTVSGQTGRTFTTSSLANGNVVTCVLTSSASCASPATATSNGQTITVVGAGGLTASVSISSSVFPLCPNTGTIFTASPTNGGTSPTYLWKVNGSSTGITTATYTSPTLNANDAVTCEMTSSFSCATPLPATSNTITVTPNITPTVSINSPITGTTACQAVQTFTANVTNGGASPVYQWRKNSTIVGTATTYSDSTLGANDTIKLTVTRSESCGLTGTATSVFFTDSKFSPTTPTISRSGLSAPCAGNSITLTASSANEGNGKVLYFNNALGTTGTAGKTGTIPFTPNGASAITFETWIKLDALTDNARVFDFGSGIGSSFFLALQGNGKMRCGVTVNYNAIVTNTTFTTGTWYHIAVVHETANSGTFSIYVNGTLDVTATATGSGLGYANYNSSLLGKSQFPDPAFRGKLDEIRIWRTARSATQISDNMNRKMSSKTTGLYYYYPADAITSTTLTDASGYGNNATLINFAGTEAVTDTISTLNQYTYAWSPSTGLNTTSGKTVITSATSNVTYTVSVTAGSGCAVTKSRDVVISGTVAPTITPSGTFTACDAQILTASGSGPWQWSNGETTQQITVTTSGTYSVTVGSCTSNDVVVTINNSAAITVQPISGTYCTGITGSFTTTVTGTANSLQWQVSTNGGSTFTNVANNATYSGATTSALSFVSNTGLSSYKYRLQASNSCTTVTSSVVTLIVKANGTWLGTANTLWNNAANWCGGVPTTSTAVILQSGATNYPVIPGAVTANAASIISDNGTSISLTGNPSTLNVTGNINLSGSLSAVAGASVNIGGSFTQNGTLNLAASVPLNLSGTSVSINTTADSLYIPNLNITGIVTSNANKLDIGSTVAGTGSLTLAANKTVYLNSGTLPFSLVASAIGSKVIYKGTSNISIPGGTYNSLQINRNGATATFVGNTFINGNFDLLAGTTALGTNNLIVNGNGTFAGTVTSSTGYVSFQNGVSNHTLTGGGTISRLLLNDAFDVLLSGNLGISGALTFTSGNLINSSTSNKVTLASGATMSGESPAGYMQGRIENTQTLGTGASTFSGIGFEIASGSEDLGTVTILRNNGATALVNPLSNSGSIYKLWSISISGTQPSSGRNITMKWISSEDNGKDITNMIGYRLENQNDPWIKLNLYGAPIDATVAGSAFLRSLTVPTTHFSDYTAGDGANLLPVTFTSFTGKQISGGNQLNWSTATEINNDRFEVERSADGKNFQKVGAVNGFGNTNQKQAYQFIDNSVAGLVNGSMYYRLKQVDFDGKYAYSNTITISPATNASNSIQAIPNPFASELTIVTNNASGIASFSIASLTGKVLVETKGLSIAENQNLVIQKSTLSILPAGMYVLQVIHSNGAIATTRIIKR